MEQTVLLPHLTMKQQVGTSNLRNEIHSYYDAHKGLKKKLKLQLALLTRSSQILVAMDKYLEIYISLFSLQTTLQNPCPVCK